MPDEQSDEEYWPEKITAQRSVTYDVESIRADLRDINDGKEPTLEEVIDQIYMYIKDDLSCGWGHEIPMREVIVFDEDGEEY